MLIYLGPGWDHHQQGGHRRGRQESQEWREARQSQEGGERWEEGAGEVQVSCQDSEQKRCKSRKEGSREQGEQGWEGERQEQIT